MDAQRALGTFLAAALVSSLVLMTTDPQPAGARTRPNIVIIMSDDQRWDSLGDMPTVMSEIVGKGVVFPNAMVPTSLCCPSRASVLLGRYAHDTGVWTNKPPWGGWLRFFDLGHERSNLATWLDASGYRTSLIGKYLNNFNRAPRDHVPRGWDVWQVFRQTKYYDYELQVGRSITFHGSDPDDYSTDVLAAAADDFLRTADPTEPVFLYLAPFGVHGPRTPAPRHVGSCSGLPPWRPPSFNEEDVSDKPNWPSAAEPQTDDQIAAIDRMRQDACETLRSVDDLVGTVIDALEDSGRLSDTLLVYMSDNGYLWGEHRLAGKNYPYDASTRIPLAIRFDGRIPAGVTDPRLALNIDVTKTALDAAALRRRHGSPGARCSRTPSARASSSKRWRGCHHLPRTAAGGPSTRRTFAMETAIPSSTTCVVTRGSSTTRSTRPTSGIGSGRSDGTPTTPAIRRRPASSGDLSGGEAPPDLRDLKTQTLHELARVVLLFRMT